MYADRNFAQCPQFGVENSQFSYGHDPNFVDQTWHPIQNYYNPIEMFTNQSLNDILNQRKHDTDFFEKFIDENSQIPSNLVKKEKSKRLGIAETKSIILSIKQLNSELEEKTLELETKNPTDDEWQKSFDVCQELKGNIQDLIEKLSKNESVCSFKKLIEKRKKKRLREKKLRDKLKRNKILMNEKRAQLHLEIDSWIREKQDVINKEKQDKILKQEADLVLSDIREKRADAKKYLETLKELCNLRTALTTNARARGEKPSAAADQSFESIIGQLSEQWKQLDEDYSIEEQSLKFTLKEDNEKIIENQKKSSFDEWEIAIFGRTLPPLDSLPKNLNNLVMNRFAWDKYISYDNKGSRIPLGWIMPDTPTSTCWQKCLKKI